MGPQPNVASRSEVLSIYKCHTKISGATFSAIPHSTPHVPGTKRRMDKQKVLVSIYNVFTTRWPTFRDLWPRNGWDTFANCDATFDGHYVANIKSATSLVTFQLTPNNDWNSSSAFVSAFWKNLRQVPEGQQYTKPVGALTHHESRNRYSIRVSTSLLRAKCVRFESQVLRVLGVHVSDSHR